jgi:hypothetical protein
VKRYYAEAASIASRTELRQQQIDSKLEEMTDAGKEIPSLTETTSPNYPSEDESPPDDELSA